MDVIRNAKLHSGVPVIGCADLCTLLRYTCDIRSPCIFIAFATMLWCKKVIKTLNDDDRFILSVSKM